MPGWPGRGEHAQFRWGHLGAVRGHWGRDNGPPISMLHKSHSLAYQIDGHEHVNVRTSTPSQWPQSQSCQCNSQPTVSQEECTQVGLRKGHHIRSWETRISDPVDDQQACSTKYIPHLSGPWDLQWGGRAGKNTFILVETRGIVRDARARRTSIWPLCLLLSICRPAYLISLSSSSLVHKDGDNNSPSLIWLFWRLNPRVYGTCLALLWNTVSSQRVVANITVMSILRNPGALPG